MAIRIMKEEYQIVAKGNHETYCSHFHAHSSLSSHTIEASLGDKSNDSVTFNFAGTRLGNLMYSLNLS